MPIPRRRWPATLVLLLALPFLLPGALRPPPQGRAEPGPAAPRLLLEDWPPTGLARDGREVYLKNCAGCHGPEGRGDGPAAARLLPRPRDFQKGYYKFRSTPGGRLPLLEDVLRTVTCGLPGSSMPSFRLHPEPERRAVSAYVIHLSLFGLVRHEVEYLCTTEGLGLEEIRGPRLQEIAARVVREEFATLAPVAIPDRPPASAELLARGAAREPRECASSQWATGRGDGPSSYALRDWEDAEIRPRDLTTGVYRAGSSPRDLFLRLKTGLNGTPMPAISGSDEDLWALVEHLLALRRPVPGRVAPAGCAEGEAGR